MPEEDLTSIEAQNQARLFILEEFLKKLKIYLDGGNQIMPGSEAHGEINLICTGSKDG